MHDCTYVKRGLAEGTAQASQRNAPLCFSLFLTVGKIADVFSCMYMGHVRTSRSCCHIQLSFQRVQAEKATTSCLPTKAVDGYGLSLNRSTRHIPLLFYHCNVGEGCRNAYNDAPGGSTQSRASLQLCTADSQPFDTTSAASEYFAFIVCMRLLLRMCSVRTATCRKASLMATRA